MDYSDHYNATKDAIVDALETIRRPPPMMPIEAFDADEDGAIFPIVRTQIFRKGAAA